VGRSRGGGVHGWVVLGRGGGEGGRLAVMKGRRLTVGRGHELGSYLPWRPIGGSWGAEAAPLKMVTAPP
jgi:hypothetical protein